MAGFLSSPIAKGESDIFIEPSMANRHGLIAGSTGTGKTVTLRVLVEQFSSIGVPVFLPDMKGDLSGLCRPGGGNKKIEERASLLQLSGFSYEGYPVRYWDLYGKDGHPVRTTVSEMGPLLLARILDLNETQTGILSMLFRYADDNQLLLIDITDLIALITYALENIAAIKGKYGNMTPASLGAIQRAILTLEEQGGDLFFGEPSLELNDIMSVHDGKGTINLLAASSLIKSPKIYSTFLLWLLSELYDDLPEVGDLEKPKFLLFFDEAHLLFSDIPKVLEEKIIQIVRLIRSKGVGVYFITQNPGDIPEDVLGQLGNRVQHALRATTPGEMRAVKTAAKSFRQNPKIDTEKIIGQLGIGEALVSVLDKSGVPTPVDRALVLPPHSNLTPLTEPEQQKEIQSSPLYGKYEKQINRHSAAEELAGREREVVVEKQKNATPAPRNTTPSRSTRRKSKDVGDVVGTIAVRTATNIGTQIGKEIVRGMLGSWLKKK
ncbi:helicase HerA-like domain-containing protein [Methanospirillum sp.]